MPGPAGLDINVCANSIVNTLTALYPNLPVATKDQMLQSWINIITDLFSHILNNLKVTVSVPNIPSNNFTLNLTAGVTIAGTEYPVTFTVATVSETAIPANTVALL